MVLGLIAKPIATNALSIFRFQHQSRTVYLIDTPGFDDTSKSDVEVLKTIAHYFGVSYAAGRRLDGLIYLHRISDNRITGTAKQNIRMFKEFVGKDNLSIVTVATTMWKEAQMNDDLEREQELLDQPAFFGEIVDGGGKLLRHGPFGSDEVEKLSALSVVSHVLRKARQRDGHCVLQIQRELVDERKSLDETGAGKVLLTQVQAAREVFERDLEELKIEWQAQLEHRDSEARQNYEEVERELKAKVAKKDSEYLAFATDIVRMNEEEEDRVLQQLDSASAQWRLELSRKEKALQESDRSGRQLQNFEKESDQAPQVNVADVESLRKELAQLRTELKVRQRQGEKVRRAFEMDRFAIATVNGGKQAFFSSSLPILCHCNSSHRLQNSCTAMMNFIKKNVIRYVITKSGAMY
jgi:hypothetical protein